MKLSFFILLLIFQYTILSAQSENKKSTLLRYDGLYCAKTNEVDVQGKKIAFYNYLKFYDDGSVYSQSVSGYHPSTVANWFGRDGKFERKGMVSIKDRLISFPTSNKESTDILLEGPMTTDFSGTIINTNTLQLEVTYHDGSKKEFLFEFVQTSDTTNIRYVAINKTVQLPGQWKVLKKGKAQMYLQNSDSTIVSLTIYKREQLPFYKKNHSPYKTALAYYNWELDYQRDEKGNIVQRIENNKKGNYIIWSTEGPDHLDRNIFLNGCSKKFAYSILVFDKKMSDKKQIQLLKQLFSLNSQPPN